MAKRIAGITIEIGGDTKNLQKSLGEVDKKLSATQNTLKDVNKLLKLDPGNTELLTQKQKALSDQVSNTKDRLQQLKDAQSGVAEGTDEWDRLQREIIETEQNLKKAEDAMKEFGSVGAQQLKVVGDKFKAVGDKMSSIGTGMSKAVTGPIVAIGAASMAAWSEVDAAMDTIVTKTGATGEALEGLQKVAENLATSIPTDFETAATAVGEVNTRFGLTGDALEDVSGKFIKFAQINGTDVNSSIDQVQATMAAWGITAEHTGSVLDMLNKVGQDTGTDVIALSGTLQDNKVIFDEMGLSISDAANFLGNLDKNGVDAGTAMAGLKKALQNAAAEGVPMSTALAQLEGTLKSGATNTAAYQAAMELFGNKAGPAIAAAVQSGQLSFTELQGTLQDFSGSVEETFAATLDPMDQMQMTMNDLKLAGADMGAAIQEAALPMIQSLAETVKTLTEGFRSLSPEQQQFIVKVGAAVAAIGPLLVVGGKVVSGIGSIISLVGSVSGAITAAGGLIPAITALATAAAPFLVGGAIIAGVIAAGVLIYQNWDTIKEKAQALWDKIKEVWEGIKNTIAGVVDKIKGLMDFEWKLPDLKLPHFTVQGEFGFNPPRVPTLGLEWYKKAYNNPVMFTQPTVLQTPSGLKGFGDGNGAEVVLGMDKLRELTQGNTVTVNVYAAQGQDVNAIANAVARKIYSGVQSRGAAIA
jgi:phage-related minor tail protein